MESDENECPQVEIHPDDVVCLPFSSGTTGLPKGVILSHKSLVSSVSQQVDGESPNLNIHVEDTILCVLPMFQIYSLNSILICGLRVGATLVIVPKFDFAKLLELTQKYKVTMGPFVPPIWKNPIVENYDLSSVKMVLSGVAPLGKELEDAFWARLPNAVLGQVPPSALEAMLVSYDAAVVPRKCETAEEVPVDFAVRTPGSRISEDEAEE